MVVQTLVAGKLDEVQANLFQKTSPGEDPISASVDHSITAIRGAAVATPKILYKSFKIWRKL